MPHVDEGELHAYLDGALGLDDPEEAERVVGHLRACPDCRARLAEAHGLRERAKEIMAEAAPAPTDLPPFEELVRRARAPAEGRGAGEGVAGEEGIPGARSGGRFPSIRTLAWAASVALAVGFGWTARDLLQRPSGPGTVALLDSAEPATEARVPADHPTEGAPPGTPGEETAAEPVAAAAAAAAVADAALRSDVWIVVEEADAARWLGGRPLRLQGVPVVDFSISAVDGERVVRARQRLESGTVVEVHQAPGQVPGGGQPRAEARELPKDAPAAERRAEGAAALPGRVAPDVVAVEKGAPADRGSAVEATIGGYRVRVVAPLAPDSLRALLSKLR